MINKFYDSDGCFMGYYCANDIELISKLYAKYQYFNKLFRRTKMIRLSTGIEISEETVVSALKAAGISVEPKHIFKAGDVANVLGSWRFIISHGSGLRSVNQFGQIQGDGTQKYFEINRYKFVGRQKDLLKK